MPIEPFPTVQPTESTTVRGTVIAYVGYLGSVGKSTMVALSALALAEQLPDQRVVLVESHAQQSPNRALRELRAKASRDTNAVAETFSQQALSEAIARVPNTELDVLLAPVQNPRFDNEEPSVEFYRKAVEALRDTYDYILVDAPVFVDQGSRFYTDFLFADADHLISVVNPTGESIANAREWLDIVTEYDGIDPRKVHAAVNQAERGVGWDEPQIRTELQGYAFAGSVPRSNKVLQAAEEPRMTVGDDAVRDALLGVLHSVTGEPDLQPPSQPQGGTIRRLLQRA